MMYLSREEREARTQSQRHEQRFRNSPMRNTLPTTSRQKPAMPRNPVAVFLHDVGLGRYAEVLIGNGFDDMETLLDIEDAHMRELGFPPGHIVKLKKRLREMQEAPTVDDVAHHQVVRIPQPPNMRQHDCTSNQMTTVQMSWVHVQNIGTEKVGEIFYKKFFKLRPDSKLLFPIGVRARYRDWTSGVDEDDDLDNSPALRKLFAKVIDAVGSAVAGLHDVGKLVPMLEKLGMRHLGYGMKDEYFQDAATVLIEVLKEGLGDMFTSDIEHAWVMVYSFMTATMIAGLRSAEAKVQAIQAHVSFSAKPSSECASEASASTDASKSVASTEASKSVASTEASRSLASTEASNSLVAETEIPAKWRIELDDESRNQPSHISLDNQQGLYTSFHGGA